MTIPLVGFIFQGEKTMIPYKEFDFLFNGITIPDLEFHFPTPWDTNLEKFRRFFYPESPILKISCNFSLLGTPIPENSCCFFQLESRISYQFLLF